MSRTGSAEAIPPRLGSPPTPARVALTEALLAEPVKSSPDPGALVDLALLPAQLERLTGGKASGVPALLVAVIEEAIACLLAERRDSESRAAAIHAERWIRSRDASFLFAFESVCHALDVDPERLRSTILRQVAEVPRFGRPRARRRHEVPRRGRRIK
jgi:hypothetical protein